MLQAAVDDRLLRSNPCNLKGAAVERSAERPIPRLEQVLALAESIKPDYRLMVLMAGLVGLRRGECFALRVGDLARGPDHWTATIDASIVFVRNEVHHQSPKTMAGVRRLALPSAVSAAVERHLADFDRANRTTSCSSPSERVRRRRSRCGVECGQTLDGIQALTAPSMICAITPAR
jgi:integrase